MDDQPETYPVERLRSMKAAHEVWVKERLARQPGGKLPHFALLLRIRTGKELSNVIDGAYAFLLDHDKPETEEEAKLIGSFLQNVQDWGDAWSDMESGQHVKAQLLPYQGNQGDRVSRFPGLWHVRKAEDAIRRQGIRLASRRHHRCASGEQGNH